MVTTLSPRVTQQLVHLQDCELAVRHGVQVAVEAIEHHQPGALHFDAVAHRGGELAGRQFGRVDLLQVQQASFDPRFDIHSQCAAAGQQGADVLVENEEGHLLAALAGGVRIGQRQRGLADPGRADQQRVGAAFQPATEHPVQHLAAGGGHLADKAGAMLGRDQARIDLQPALRMTKSW